MEKEKEGGCGDVADVAPFYFYKNVKLRISACSFFSDDGGLLWYILSHIISSGVFALILIV